MSKVEMENVGASYSDRHNGTPMEVLHRFTVLRPGWECDEKGLVVRTPEGKSAIAFTSHNGPWYLAAESEIKDFLQEYRDYVEGMRKVVNIIGIEDHG